MPKKHKSVKIFGSGNKIVNTMIKNNLLATQLGFITPLHIITVYMLEITTFFLYKNKPNILGVSQIEKHYRTTYLLPISHSQ